MSDPVLNVPLELEPAAPPPGGGATALLGNPDFRRRPGGGYVRIDLPEEGDHAHCQ